MNNSDSDSHSISTPVLNRMPVYLNYLIIKNKDGQKRISSTIIAQDLKLNPVQVRKDLALTGIVGKPKTGFEISELIFQIKEMLGYNKKDNAILIGAGRLGRTLLSYDGFSNYGLNILAAFDMDNSLFNLDINGKKIYPLNKISDYVKKHNVNIGIITVPANNAQAICDQLVDCGIRAIWNFAPTHLSVPDHVIVQYENMAASLAILSNKLSESLNKHPNKE